MNNPGCSIKKQRLYFKTGSMRGAVNRAHRLQHWEFVTLFALWGNHFLPSQHRQEVTFGRLEEKNPFLNGQIKPQLCEAVGFIKASWLKLGLEESWEVDGAWPCISTTPFPLNCARRRIALVLFITGQHLSPSPHLILKILPGVESGVWQAEGRRAGWLFVRRSAGLWLPLLVR